MQLAVPGTGNGRRFLALGSGILRGFWGLPGCVSGPWRSRAKRPILVTKECFSQTCLRKARFWSAAKWLGPGKVRPCGNAIKSQIWPTSWAFAPAGPAKKEMLKRSHRPGLNWEPAPTVMRAVPLLAVFANLSKQRSGVFRDRPKLVPSPIERLFLAPARRRNLASPRVVSAARAH